jgi:hypothetical protein
MVGVFPETKAANEAATKKHRRVIELSLEDSLVSLVEALLLGGTTGAGLVLTAYSLVVSRADDLLSQRADELQESKLSLEKQMDEVRSKPETSSEQFTKLRKELNKVEAKQALPSYFGEGIAIAFLGYSALAILAGVWLMGSFQESIRPWLIPIFIGSTAAFAYSGISGIIDIRHYLNREFQEMKKERSQPKT